MRTDKSTMRNTETNVETTTYETNIIRTGSGDDRIEINGNITTSDTGKNPYSNILDAGDGNNTIILNGSVQAGSLKIITGDGYDTLVLKADSFEHLKSFYGGWLSVLKNKDMIKDMSIDCIDIQCGDTATVQNTLAWLKSIMGTELAKVTLNDGETVVHEPAVAAAPALALLDPGSDDNGEQPQQTLPDDDGQNSAEGHDNLLQVLSASLFASEDTGITTTAHDDISPARADSDDMFADEDVIDASLFGEIDASNASALGAQEDIYATPSDGSGIQYLFVENDSLDSLLHDEVGAISILPNAEGISALDIIDLTNRDALEKIRETATENVRQEILTVENDIPAAVIAEQQVATSEDTSRQMIDSDRYKNILRLTTSYCCSS